LKEIQAVLRRQGIRTSQTALWRFLDRQNITRKKKTLHAAEQQRADVARARRKWIREQGLLDTTKLVFIDETSVNTSMVRLYGRCPCGVRLVDHVPLETTTNYSSTADRGADHVSVPSTLWRDRTCSEAIRLSWR
jgi:hypothetical protein